MHLVDAAWAVLLLPVAGVGASYLTETRRGAATAVVGGSWLTLVAALLVVAGAVAKSPEIHQATVTLWSFPVTQSPFNAASSTLLAANFEVGFGYAATPVAAALVATVTLAVLLGQSQIMSQLRSDPRLPSLMRLTALLAFGAIAVIMAPGLFQVVLGFELCGLAAALLIGSSSRAGTGRVARRVYVGWRLGALSLLLATVFIYVKFAGQVEAVATSTVHKGVTPNRYGLNFSALESIWAAAAHGQVHGVGGRTLTLAAVLIVVAAASACGILPLQGLWRGLVRAPGASAAVVLPVVGVAIGTSLLAQTYALLTVASAVLPILTVLASTSAVVMAGLALRERRVMRLAALTSGSLASSSVVGFGLGSSAGGVAFAVSGILVVGVLAGTATHLSRDLRVDTLARLGPAWRLARTSVLLLLGALGAAAGVVGVGTFFGRSAVLSAALSGPGEGLADPGWLARLVGGCGLLAAGFLLAVTFGRVVKAATSGVESSDPREARAARRHLSQARPGNQVVILRIGLALALLSGLLSLPGLHYGLGSFLSTHRAANALGFNWVALGLTLLLPLAGTAIGFAVFPIVDPDRQQIRRWADWLDGSAAADLAERVAIGWPGRAVAFVTQAVMEPLSDSATQAVTRTFDPNWPASDQPTSWGLRSAAATLAAVAVGVGILVWVAVAHPGGVGAP